MNEIKSRSKIRFLTLPVKMRVVNIILGSLLLTGTLVLPIQATTSNNEETVINIEKEAMESTQNIEHEIEGENPLLAGPTAQTIAEIFLDTKVAEIVAKELNLTVDSIVTQDQLMTIKKLVISDKSVNDLTGLENLTELEFLSLANTQVTNLNEIKQLDNLGTLFLYYNQKLEDYSILSELTQLGVLSLSTNSLTQLPNIVNTDNLKGLYLEVPLVTDYSQVSNLENLTDLSINYAGQNITSLDFIKGLKNLQDLSVENAALTSLLPVAELPNLTSLSFSNNQITDLSPLSSLEKLYSIRGGNNYISDLSELKQLTKLTIVSLPYNNILDASALKNVYMVDLTKQVILFDATFPGADAYVENQVIGLDGGLISPRLISNNGYYLDGKIYFTNLAIDTKPAYTFNVGAEDIPLPDLSGMSLTDNQNFSQLDSSVEGASANFDIETLENQYFSFSGVVAYFFTEDEKGDVTEENKTGTLPETGENLLGKSILGVSISIVGILILILKAKKLRTKRL